jgi:hypothetical protein
MASLPLERLGGDFFKGHSSIIVVKFYNCSLKIIDPQVLNPLTHLIMADFKYNDCIDMEALTNFHELTAEFEANCQDHQQSFVQRHRFAISFFCISTLVLGVLFLKHHREKIREQWNELNLA